MKTVREVTAAMRGIPDVFMPAPRFPEPVFVAPETWVAAWTELCNDPRIIELYGVPPIANLPDLRAPNFLLLGVPVAPDDRVPVGEVHRR